MNNFRDRLETALRKAGLTQTELANRTKISRSRICRYLRGDYVPKQDAIYAMAKELKVSPGWLWGFGDSPTPDALFVNVNLSFLEHQMLTEYRLLNEDGQRIVNETINAVRKTKSLNRS